MDEQQTIAPYWPPETLPTVFADGIINLAQTGEVVKFYLARSDPSTNTPNDNKVQVFAQVVMTMTGFVDAALFFERALKGYVERGIISQERVDTARSAPAK